MNSPLPAQTLNEARYYLKVTACDACGKGPWVLADSSPRPPTTGDVCIHATCQHCGRQHEFSFFCQAASVDHGLEGELINPTDQPSRIVDLAQWLSLFYMLIESASAGDDRAETRRVGYQAAQCLTEALHFYGDNELPDKSAFFTDHTRTIFREHPEKFARQHLRDMQTKLPALGNMANRVAEDGRPAGKRWWQFWKK